MLADLIGWKLTGLLAPDESRLVEITALVHWEDAQELIPGGKVVMLGVSESADAPEHHEGQMKMEDEDDAKG